MTTSPLDKTAILGAFTAAAMLVAAAPAAARPRINETPDALMAAWR